MAEVSKHDEVAFGLVSLSFRIDGMVEDSKRVMENLSPLLREERVSQETLELLPAVGKHLQRLADITAEVSALVNKAAKENPPRKRRKR